MKEETTTKRVIKFRAWNTEEKRFHGPETLKEMRNMKFTSFYGEWKDKEMVFQEFTGLTDKNGKEIYEGDIYVHNDRKWLIKYSENQFVLLAKEVGSKTNWRSLEDVNRMKKYIEVIGNIYENQPL